MHKMLKEKIDAAKANIENSAKNSTQTVDLLGSMVKNTEKLSKF